MPIKSMPGNIAEHIANAIDIAIAHNWKSIEPQQTIFEASEDMYRWSVETRETGGAWAECAMGMNNGD